MSLSEVEAVTVPSHRSGDLGSGDGHPGSHSCRHIELRWPDPILGAGDMGGRDSDTVLVHMEPEYLVKETDSRHEKRIPCEEMGRLFG